MDIYICDNTFNAIQVVDDYSSAIWTERYSSAGDFQIEMPYKDSLFHLLTDNNGLENDFYARIKDSNTIMMIEEVSVITDAESGNVLTLKGRSLEAMLDRRVIYGQTEVLADIETDIFQLISENAINPTDSSRTIPNLTMVNSQDSRITSISYEAQYYFDNLYEKVEEICKAYSIGFRIWLNNGNKEFKLFMGEDRSFGQSDFNIVIFSPRFDNLISSNYVESVADMDNVSYIAGEGERNQSMISSKSRNDLTFSGMKRRELYIDGKDVSKTIEGEDGRQRHLTDAEYLTELGNKGLEELSNHEYKRSFDGEVESSLTFKFGVDYFIGDLVEIENEYQMHAKARVDELIRSYDSNGYKEYPTFTKIEV